MNSTAGSYIATEKGINLTTAGHGYYWFCNIQTLTKPNIRIGTLACNHQVYSHDLLLRNMC